MAILSDIKTAIEKFEAKPIRSNVGTIISLADSVAKIEGLSEVMYNEMVEFSDNVSE